MSITRASFVRCPLDKKGIALLSKLHRATLRGGGLPDWENSSMWLIYSKPSGKQSRDSYQLVGFTGIKPADEDEDHVFMFRTGILKPYRGQGFHKAAIRHRLKYIKRKGAVRAFTYVAPDNWPSLCALIKCGFRLYESRWAGSDFLHLQKWV